MSRAEHLEWCKKRAIELIESGDINQGLISMMSDLGKHDETRGHVGIALTSLMMLNGHLSSIPQAIEHIKGFN